MAKSPDGAADVLVRRYGLAAPGDLQIDDIAFAERMVVHYAPLHGCQATLVTGDPYGIARIREDLPFAGQKRFAAAHELGHWILHRGLRQEFRDDEASLADYRGSGPEIEANAFASALLLPERLVRPYATAPDGEAVRAAIADFGVGPVAATRRLIGLTPAPAVAIVAHAGRARYYVPARTHALGPFPPGRAIPDGDETARATVGATEAAHAWWPGRSGDVRVSALPVALTGETIYLLTPAL